MNQLLQECVMLLDEAKREERANNEKASTSKNIAKNIRDAAMNTYMSAGPDASGMHIINSLQLQPSPIVSELQTRQVKSRLVQ